MDRRACALLAPALLLAGCANPGPPRPPSLNLPRVSTDLSAERQGSRVQLSWTVADYTTDNLLLPGARAKSSYTTKHVAHSGALAAEICREDIAAHSPCQSITRVTVHAGEHVTAEDSLPRSLQTGAPHLIAYRVRVLNAAGRDAGLSAPAFAASGEAPAPMEDLRVRSVRQGAELRWKPSLQPAPGEEVRITREKLSSKTPGENNTVDLRIPAAPDPGGAVDRGAKADNSFRYSAVRVVHLALGNRQLRIFGDPATVTSGVLTDTFPPPAPTDLVAVATPASEARKAAIDLSWEPVPEDALAGYVVYRTAGAGSPQRVTDAPITGSAYHDEAVTAGQSYTYTITAVDRSGNESPRSNSASETVQ